MCIPNIKRGKITQYLLCALHIISTQEKSLYLSSSLSYAVALSSLLYLVYRFVLCDLWMYNVKTSAHVLCVKNYIHFFQGHFFADVNSNTHVGIDRIIDFTRKWFLSQLISVRGVALAINNIILSKDQSYSTRKCSDF